MSISARKPIGAVWVKSREHCDGILTKCTYPGMICNVRCGLVWRLVNLPGSKLYPSRIFLLAALGKSYIKALVSLFDPMLVVANQGDQTATAGVLVGVKQVRGTCYFIALEDRPQ